MISASAPVASALLSHPSTAACRGFKNIGESHEHVGQGEVRTFRDVSFQSLRSWLDTDPALSSRWSGGFARSALHLIAGCRLRALKE